MQPYRRWSPTERRAYLSKVWRRSNWCWICGRAILRGHWISVMQETRDHILPRFRRSPVPVFDVINSKSACKHCNEMRAVAGHCVANLACIRATLPKVRQFNESAIKARMVKWGIHARQHGDVDV